MGTAAIGRPQYINIRDRDDAPFSLPEFRQRGLEMLDYAYDRGIRYFDTAPGYGLAEELMIDWVKERDDPEIIVATKWGYTYVADFDLNAQMHEVKEHTLSKLEQQWRVSKQLLPNLNYYQIHSATLASGVLENEAVLDRLLQLKEAYDIKVGLTTTGSDQATVLRKAMRVQRNGAALFDVFQCTYNILDQSIHTLGLEIIASKKQLVIKEALANGRLLPNPRYAHYAPLYKKLEKLASKYGLGVDAIALQYGLSKLEGAMVLSGAGRPEHLVQNLQAADFRLTQQEVESLAKFKISPEAYWAERKALTWN